MYIFWITILSNIFLSLVKLWKPSWQIHCVYNSILLYYSRLFIGEIAKPLNCLNYWFWSGWALFEFVMYLLWEFQIYLDNSYWIVSSLYNIIQWGSLFFKTSDICKVNDGSLRMRTRCSRPNPSKFLILPYTFSQLDVCYALYHISYSLKIQNNHVFGVLALITSQHMLSDLALLQ